MPRKKEKTEEKTEATENGRKPSEQALQAVDVAVGAVPTVADTVSETAETWRKSETRTAEIDALRERLGNEIKKAETKGGDVRRQVSDQLIGQARKARERVEPVYRDHVEPVVKERVEPVYKKRFEPIVKERVEPVYRKRFEPTVNRVRERI
jgi:alkanesulfonate monooxygenase SsuD/methylene tetrahydromethanopterin reductase-like flavin-dependent oxidoreductase (luciferase family)